MRQRRTLLVPLRAWYAHLWCPFGMESRLCPV